MPTIALVDDDRNILTSVSIALEAEGYRIMTYTDGASALDGIKSSPPDLAILDIKMPRMDGMETLRRLRQTSDVPVIFLTSKNEEIDELFGRSTSKPCCAATPTRRAPNRRQLMPPRCWSTACSGWTRSATSAPGKTNRSRSPSLNF